MGKKIGDQAGARCFTFAEDTWGRKSEVTKSIRCGMNDILSMASGPCPWYAERGQLRRSASSPERASSTAGKHETNSPNLAKFVTHTRQVLRGNLSRDRQAPETTGNGTLGETA
jgi:hypothetical protein